jgi:hypothetical protein
MLMIASSFTQCEWPFLRSRTTPFRGLPFAISAPDHYGGWGAFPYAKRVAAMRAFAIASLIAGIVPAPAQSLLVGGHFGYLGEYEFSAEVVPKASNETEEFSGPLTLRHIGLCTHNGPNQMDGQIQLQFSNKTSQIAATLSFDEQRCTYSGNMSKTDVGELVCSSGAVPFSIWSK